MTDDAMAVKFEEAVEFAIACLDLFDETGGLAPISTVLDYVEQRLEEALRQGKGLDPRTVQWAIQSILDVANFPSNNGPFVAEDTPPADGPHVTVPQFQRQKSRGRRPDRRLNDSIATVVGMVARRFNLTRTRNGEPSMHKALDGKNSASDVVAEAQLRRKRTPATFEGVRACVERSRTGRTAFESADLLDLPELDLLRGPRARGCSSD